MQNTSIGNKNTSKQLHQISENARDTMESMSSDMSNRAKSMMKDTSDKASQYYDQAQSWLGENYGKTLGFIGLMVASGVVGYMIGRNQESSQDEFSSPTYHS